MCQCQQYNYLMCCHGNATVLSLVLFSVLLSNICSCQHYKTYVDFHVKCLVFLSDFNQIWIFLGDFHKSLHIKLHENLSGGSLLSDFNQIWIFLTVFHTSLHIKFHENLSGGSLLFDFNQIRIFLTDFHNLHIKFHENLSGGSRAFTRGQMVRWTDMMNLMGSFHENT